VTTDPQTYERVAPELASGLRRLLGGAEVDPSRHDNLSAGGKFRAFMLGER
jgi:hypothetical protein